MLVRETNLSSKGSSDISELLKKKLEKMRRMLEYKKLLEKREVPKKLPSSLWKAA